MAVQTIIESLEFHLFKKKAKKKSFENKFYTNG
jgi:hypothetical protein